jgi:hypothetical protein
VTSRRAATQQSFEAGGQLVHGMVCGSLRPYERHRAPNVTLALLG